MKDGDKDRVITLKPVRIFDTNLDQVGSKMKELGLNENSMGGGNSMGENKKR